MSIYSTFSVCQYSRIPKKYTNQIYFEYYIKFDGDVVEKFGNYNAKKSIAIF